jgi:hypothetical protein
MTINTGRAQANRGLDARLRGAVLEAAQRDHG